jgi:hypothetical protein
MDAGSTGFEVVTSNMGDANKKGEVAAFEVVSVGSILCTVVISLTIS